MGVSSITFLFWGKVCHWAGIMYVRKMVLRKSKIKHTIPGRYAEDLLSIGWQELLVWASLLTESEVCCLGLYQRTRTQYLSKWNGFTYSLGCTWKDSFSVFLSLSLSSVVCTKRTPQRCACGFGCEVRHRIRSLWWLPPLALLEPGLGAVLRLGMEFLEAFVSLGSLTCSYDLSSFLSLHQSWEIWRGVKFWDKTVLKHHEEYSRNETVIKYQLVPCNQV